MKGLKSEIWNLKLRLWRWGAALATIVVALGGATAAHAQGCAMCYNVASSASAAAIQALRSGILVLTFPPVVIFVAIFVLVLRRRNRFDDEALDGLAVGGGVSREPDSLEAARIEDEILLRAEFQVSVAAATAFREPATDAELAASAENAWK